MPQNGGRTYTTEKNVGKNENGTLYMDRADFYKVMNVNVVEFSQNISVSKMGNNIKSYTASALVSMGAYVLEAGPISSFLAGVVVNELVNSQLFEPGDYRVEYTVGEVYDGSISSYKSLYTLSYYKIGVDENGKPNEQYVKSVTKFFGTYKESVISNADYVQ